MSRILNSLQTPVNKVAMGTDNFDNHLKPAVAAGGRSFWLTQQTPSDCPRLSLSLII
jgi:hypothetical protein